MNRTEQLELLATAFISEVATVCEDYGDAGEAVLAAKIEDAKATFVRLCKERHTQAVSGKGLWGLATTTYAYMAFFKKAEKWLPKLIEGAAMVANLEAEELAEDASEAELVAALSAILPAEPVAETPVEPVAE
jgi:hypothetical protein